MIMFRMLDVTNPQPNISSPSGPVIIREDPTVIALNLTTWISITIAALIALLKISSKYLKIGKLQIDDYLILIAVVFASGETIAVTEQVKSGLGRNESSLTSQQLDDYQKAAYAAQFLYFSSLAFAKIAHAQFATVLSSKPFALIAGRIIIGFTILWVITALFTVAFQCPLPTPWMILSSQCINETAFWGAMAAFDVLIDLSLSALPFFILYDVQMKFTAKAAVTVAFAARLIVVPVTIIRVVFFAEARDDPDRTFSQAKTVIVAQIGLNLSIIATCVPFLKIVLERVEAGLFTSDLRYAPGGTSYARRFVEKTRALNLGINRVDEDIDAAPGDRRTRATSIVREQTDSDTRPPMKPLEMAFNPQTAVANATGSPAVSCCSDEMYISNRMSVNVHTDRERQSSDSSESSFQKQFRRPSKVLKTKRVPSPYAQYDDLWEVSSEDTAVGDYDPDYGSKRRQDDSSKRDSQLLAALSADTTEVKQQHDTADEEQNTGTWPLPEPTIRMPLRTASLSNRASSSISPFSQQKGPFG